MNATQIKVAQQVTGGCWLPLKLGREFSNLTFEKTEETEDYVRLFGSNCDTKDWLDRLACVSLRIGKRGGVKIIRKYCH